MARQDMATQDELLALWAEPEGHPYKGELIDWDAYEANPDSISCMCAQGQALHLIGGWSPERINETEQTNADKEVAALLNISVAHAILLRQINDKVDGAPGIVLTDPDKVLGGEWSRVLDFWWYLDQMTPEQWAAVKNAAAWDAAWAAARAAAARDAAARDAAWDAARDAAWDAAARDAAWAAARAAAARDAAWAAAWDAARACSEIQGAHFLRKRGEQLFFLPLFGFASPEDVPARPSAYGKTAEGRVMARQDMANAATLIIPQLTNEQTLHLIGALADRLTVDCDGIAELATAIAWARLPEGSEDDYSAEMDADRMVPQGRPTAAVWVEHRVYRDATLARAGIVLAQRVRAAAA